MQPANCGLRFNKGKHAQVLNLNVAGPTSFTERPLMRVLREGFNPDRFFSHLHQADRRVLFLDYDGTLAPFRVQRNEAVPYPGVRRALALLQRGEHTRLVIVSGRACADVLLLLGLDDIPEVWGSHGWERRLPG